MKRFHFQLDTALSYRERRKETEQARLDDLLQQRLKLVSASAEVECQWEAAQDLVIRAAAVETTDLAALENFRRSTARQKTRLTSEIRQVDERILFQRRQLMEATREFRLLEKLKQRRQKEWTAGVERELESDAGDFYLAKWGREPPPDDQAG